MKWENFLDELAGDFKLPETLEEAVAFIDKDPSLQTVVEEMSFRQVIVNILVAAEIITEKDFNASVEHFKKLFTKQFAKELLSRINEFKKKYNFDEDTGEFLDDDFEDDDEDKGPPHYDA